MESSISRIRKTKEAVHVRAASRVWGPGTGGESIYRGSDTRGGRCHNGIQFDVMVNSKPLTVDQDWKYVRSKSRDPNHVPQEDEKNNNICFDNKKECPIFAIALRESTKI